MLDYPGAYEVGITTVETAPTTANDFGVMASIFYPADSSYSRQAPKAKWLHGPSKFYAVGYGTYARLPPWFSKTVLSWTLSQVQMPARAEAPFITTKEQPFKSPVVIFCHGLAGNSTTYSTFCGSLASRGFVVLSIEHRDGSASVTAKNNYSEPIQYIPPPANDSNAERKFRQGQLVQRVHEVNEAHSLLQALNNGETIQNLLNHALPNFKNRLDIENSILIGHSFGAVTALAALQQPNHPFITGITFDPWMWPLPSHEPAIRIPMLSMQAQKFHWKDNVD
ncbi:Platelet-activating factor acetylhydrolase, partial [Rhizoclosmatium hyalinum]